MKSQWILTGMMLATIMAAGCGRQVAGPNAPAAPVAPTPQVTTAPAATAPAATAPAATATAARATSSSVTKYAVVADQSSASYSVHEKLLGRNLNQTAVGKTSAFKGELVLENGVIKPSTVQVDVSTLKSDEDRRDNQVRRALDTGNHQFASFSITGTDGNLALKEGQEVAIKLLGTLTIKGTEKPVVFDAKGKLTGDTLTLAAETTFKMTTFGVNPPNIANMVAVDDEVKLNVTFVGKMQ